MVAVGHRMPTWLRLGVKIRGRHFGITFSKKQNLGLGGLSSFFVLKWIEVFIPIILVLLFESEKITVCLNNVAVV